MRRSEAAVSVEVKRVIGALCKLLTSTGLQDVPPPETFRRAKFGGGMEVDNQLLQLLANILRTSGTVSYEDHVGRDLRKLVVVGLWQTGYYVDWMCDGDEGEGRGGRFSSRDLLLALGWLLASGTLERLLTQRVQQLDKTVLTPTHANLQLSNEFQLDSESLKKLQWLIGCLRNQGRCLLSMQDERAHSLHAVLIALLSSSVPPLVQSSLVLKEDCVCMQQLCELLETYLTWKQVEKVFWSWMDSVVDSHLMVPLVEKPTHAPDGSAKRCYHGNQGLEKLEEMLLRLPTAQAGHRRDRGQGLTIQESSDTSSLPPLLSPLPSMPSFPQVYRARFQTERLVGRSGVPVEEPCDRTEAPNEMLVSQAQQRLLHTEALLLERRNRQRLASRMQLQDMIGRLDGLALIPPP